MVSEQSNAHMYFMVIHLNGIKHRARRGQTLSNWLPNVSAIQRDILMKTISGMCLMINMIQRQKPGV